VRMEISSCDAMAHPLVALTPPGTLLDCAKDLFVGAKQVWRAMLTPSGQELHLLADKHRNQNTDDDPT
jgi:hypothetical protein